MSDVTQLTNSQILTRLNNLEKHINNLDDQEKMELQNLRFEADARELFESGAEFVAGLKKHLENWD